MLLIHALGIDRARLYARLADPVPAMTATDYEALLERRAAGEPVAYLTGVREFMGLAFLVDPRVLIPRPETERLVEWGLARLRGAGGPARVVDVGTGSGAIAVSLACLSAPAGDGRLLITGCDLSGEALAVAAGNVERLAPGRVALVRADLLQWCRGPIDLILANLPYLRRDQLHPGIAREPTAALVAEDAGFALYARLLPQAAALLTPGGSLGCEIDPAQRDRALALARQHFPAAQVRVEPDLAGQDRYLLLAVPPAR